MDFNERLESVMQKQKVTQKELSEIALVRRATISEWKKRGTIPSADIALKIAEYLHVSIEWLVTGKEKDFTREDLELLALFNALKEPTKSNFKVQLKALVDNQKE